MENGPIRILMVVNQEVHTDLLHRAFDAYQAEYEIRVSRTIKDAMSAISATVPHLIITDLWLPDGKGTAFLPEVLSDPQFPVVVMAPQSDQAGVDIMKAGAFDYVVQSETTLLNMPHTAQRVLREWMFLSQRREAEEKLRESEARYRSFVENFSGLFFRTGYGYHPLFIHGSIVSITGYEEIEFLENVVKWNELIYPEDLEKYEQGLKGVRNHPDLSIESEYRIVRKDGQLRWVQEYIQNICTPSGSPKYLQGIIYDITRRKSLESRLYQAQKMEALGTLAGGIAHDFNNVLASIMGFTELAYMDAPEEGGVRRGLQKVLTASERAKSLIGQILTFSRQAEEARKPIKIAPIIREVKNLLRATLSPTIDIQFQLASDAGIVMADPTRIHQVLMNLCTNAGHAMREKGGVLTIRLSNIDTESGVGYRDVGLQPGPYVCLSVIDTGAGMSPGLVGRIFEPYFSTKKKGEGTGLGLAVVHGIVKKYGGAVTVQSDLGRGTRVEVYLPAVADKAVPESFANRSLPKGNERILFVDDEPTLVEAGKKMLERLGYQVVTCLDGQAALDLFLKAPFDFDMLVTDMIMPNMTGDELARRVLNIRPNMPILLCSGFIPGAADRKNGKPEGRAIAIKPLSIQTLATKIRDAIEGKSV